jgi:hypothetical protein
LDRQPRTWRCPPPPPAHREGEGLGEVARRTLLALVSAPQILLDSCVGGAGVDEEQARVNRSVVRGSRAMPPPPSARSRMRCFSKGATACLWFVVKANLRLGPGPRLGGEGAHKAVDLVVVLAEGTDGNIRDTT